MPADCKLCRRRFTMPVIGPAAGRGRVRGSGGGGARPRAVDRAIGWRRGARERARMLASWRPAVWSQVRGRPESHQRGQRPAPQPPAQTVELRDTDAWRHPARAWRRHESRSRPPRRRTRHRPRSAPRRRRGPHRRRSAEPTTAMAGRNAERGVHVYRGVRDGKTVYHGITNNLVARQRAHRARFAIRPLTTKSVTRGQARAIEEVRIADNLGDPAFDNIRHSISPNHSWYSDAVAWGREWLQRNGF